MGEVYEASVKSLASDLLARKKRVEKSLISLKNQDGWYADDHRRMLKLYNALIETFSRETGTARGVRTAP
jgi:hypothetical protein